MSQITLALNSQDDAFHPEFEDVLP